MQRWDPIVIVFLAFTLFWVKSPIRVRMSLSCGLSVIRGQFCESLLITAFLSGLSAAANASSSRHFDYG